MCREERRDERPGRSVDEHARRHGLSHSNRAPPACHNHTLAGTEQIASAFVSRAWQEPHRTTIAARPSVATVRSAWVQQQQQQQAVAAKGKPARVRSGRAVGPRDPAFFLTNRLFKERTGPIPEPRRQLSSTQCLSSHSHGLQTSNILRAGLISAAPSAMLHTVVARCFMIWRGACKWRGAC